ncbi:MAG: hypothetical protein ACK4SX_10975 [Alcanivoracaceae bacterium]
MRSPLLSLMLALMLWQLPGTTLRAEELQANIIDRFPLTDQLAADQSLYLRIRYSSPEPVRFQARAVATGNQPAGAMMNPAPLYPAGDGEALAWIGFRHAAAPEGIEVHVSNHSWKTLVVLPLPAPPVWTPSSAPAGVMPDWVEQLSSQQQQMTSEHLQRAGHNEGGDWLILLMAWSVPGYFLLQGWVWLRWQPPWRRAGLLPLWASLPVTGYTVFALLMGSNLWPLVMLFVMPVLTIYLLAIAVIRTRL